MEGLGPSEVALRATSPDPLNPTKNKKETKNTTKQKQKIRRVKGQVRWPFGPPHMTLKPSKKKHKQQKHEKPKKEKTKKRKNTRKTKKYSKMSFSIISQIFLFLGGCPQFPFIDNLAQKAHTLKAR